jgi:hypothetical protein
MVGTARISPRTVISGRDVAAAALSPSEGVLLAAPALGRLAREPGLAAPADMAIGPDIELGAGPPLSIEPSVGKVAPTPPLKPDRYTSRLLKYIPAEVIALYLTLDGLIRSSDKVPVSLHWGVFAFGVVGTYLYLWRVASVTKQTQLIISVIAYCVWVFALGGPFVHLNWYVPIYGALLLPVYTFFVGIIEV